MNLKIQNEEELYSVKQVSEILNLSEQTIYKMATNKEIRSLRIGDIWRFKKQDIEELKEWNSNVSDVATMLKLSPATVYKLVKKKEIPVKKMSGSLRFRKMDINEWIDKKAK